jgi:hypothetical protein
MLIYSKTLAGSADYVAVLLHHCRHKQQLQMLFIHGVTPPQTMKGLNLMILRTLKYVN